MRVITGKYRGRKLEAPSGYDTRPTSDKVKESIFNILMQDIPGAVVCDLFAGTGGLGIEALSRGAEKCYFCDQSREAIRLIIHNLEHCGAEKDGIVIAGDYRKTLGRIREKIDVFFVDPPYRAGMYENCLEMIDSLDLLAPQGIILAEYETRNALPEEIGGLVKTKTYRYGKTSLALFQRREDLAQTLEEEDD